MEKPQNQNVSDNANDANDLSISFASLLPRSPEDVGSFLFEAAYALGEREADLARELGVSRATLSGWKGRGAIPPAHLDWFAKDFVIAVLTARAPKQHEGFRHAGLELVLALFQRSNFDPFGIDLGDPQARVKVCHSYLGGLARLALFVMHRKPEPLHPTSIDNVDLLDSLTRAAAKRLRFP